MFGGCYAGRRVLVTGHTGFKGSWLTLWLTRMGAQVSGISLPASTHPSHWALLQSSSGLAIERDIHLDIRDASAVMQAIRECAPEIVFHLAAQSLVRPSYAEPIGTWATNVMGTAHVLEACRQTASVRAIVAVTSDKCYENHESAAGYLEDDRLGGHDPYSASKAGAELVAASWRQSFFTRADSPALATARAGNVIGGGDWSQDRLIPDLVRAIASGEPLVVRSPNSTRPWQHVLESLCGYLLLGQRLLEGGNEARSAWNFGPARGDACTVGDVLARLRSHWPQLAWTTDAGPHPHETTMLQLDSSKAVNGLGWQPVWALDEALAATAGWYRSYLLEGRVRSDADIDAYVAAAREKSLPWASA